MTELIHAGEDAGPIIAKRPTRGWPPRMCALPRPACDERHRSALWRARSLLRGSPAARHWGVDPAVLCV